MTIQELKDLIVFCKEQGIASFEFESAKVSFDPRSLPIEMKDIKLSPEELKAQAETYFKDQAKDSDKDLFWSVD